MSNQLVWQERFNIGVDFIDKEHKRLFSILNRLFSSASQADKSQWACQEGIKYFKEHAMKHFMEEESYMASIDYVGFETHRRLHDNFRKKTLPELEKELVQSTFSSEAINHFLGVCAGWLIGHTLTEDHAITGKALSQWSELLPDEGQAMMKQNIAQLLYDMFRLKARVVSECYGGEKFGKGIYYRLAYENKTGEKWETILVFEEKLLVHTVGSIMGAKEDETMDVMLMNAVRYTAQQFVNRIRENLPESDQYELKEENLLTYDQFQKVFARQRPQFSLLFNTGEGYFAYCSIAPHLVKHGIGTSIQEDNAMSEIKKYLKKDPGGSKKKILVVDDSAVVRQSMKELLEPEYEVTLANSGMSAIRCITLDRPDLVLLDYEMPVCNGNQVLEMIRADDEFADTPVMFLTGMTDRDSIIKIMSLNPAGYLLKTLQPAEIRKIISEYFKKAR